MLFSIRSLTLLVILWLVTCQAWAKPSPKVLMVVSGYGQQQGKVAPGYEFDEFAKAYLVFKQHGITVDIASPKGGSVESDDYDPEKSYNANVLADPAIMAKLNHTLAIASLKASDYQGVFIVGGKGAMFDLPKDTALQQLIADIYQQRGSIAAVCHGPAALVDVRLSDGSFLVADKAVNGFTNTEEKLFGKKWVKTFDFMLQDKLIERGGKFESSPMMLAHLTVDGRLITGQNPSSTVAVANALVESLGITLKPAKAYRDDLTLAMVAKVLAGDKQAASELAADAEQYHLPLVGMYGFYYLQVANQPQEYRHALSLMQAAQQAINNPQLDIQIAQAQHKLGETQAARATLQQILASKPDFAPALTVLNNLNAK